MTETDTSKATPRHRPSCDALGCSVSCPIAAMRDAMRKAASELDRIIAVQAVTDTTRRIAHDLLAAVESNPQPVPTPTEVEPCRQPGWHKSGACNCFKAAAEGKVE